MTIRIQLLLALFLSASSFSFSAHAESNALYYILDFSGSMWGRVDGQIKSNVAKKTLAELLPQIPAEYAVGLTVYGHRRQSDCKDIEELIPLGAADKEALLSKVLRLQPKGKTPLSEAVTRVAEKLKGREAETTIVLISDGIETCDKDPCAVVKALKESGAKFVLHVVGFDTGSEAAPQLQCMANAGGGQYFLAKDGPTLAAALKAVKESVVEKKVLPTAPPPSATATPLEQKLSSHSSSIRVKATGPAKLVLKYDSWLKEPYFWKLYNPESKDAIGRFTGFGPVNLTPGTYQLEWRQSEHGSTDVLLGEVFTAEAGKTTEVSLRTGLEITVPQWVKAPYFWKLLSPETHDEVVRFRESLEPQLVPPGEFELVWQQREHATSDINFGIIRVEADKLNKVTIASGAHLVPADWVSAKPYYWMLTDTSNSKKRYRFADDLSSQLVAPGKYAVALRIDEHGTSDSILGEIEIKEGELSEFPINTGIKLIPQPGTPAPYKVQFVSLDSNFTVTMSNQIIPMPLKPGKYKIVLRQKQHGDTDVTIMESLEVPAGALVEVEL